MTAAPKYTLTFSGSQTDLVTYLRQWSAEERAAAKKKRGRNSEAYAAGLADGIQEAADILARTTLTPEGTET